jgi:hypothetical protein
MQGILFEHPFLNRVFQVSAGVWRLITQNVSSLPKLRLDQWQILFDIIAVGAAAGGYSSVKAFEVGCVSYCYRFLD